MRSPATDKLPYSEAFSPGEKVVIEEALRQAAAALKLTTLDLSNCSEVEITVELEDILNRMLESSPPVVRGFTKAFFQTVVRGAEVCTHDLSMPEKRPDLTFRSQRKLPLLRFPHHCALFVECKIVDKSHAIGLYGANGILRFVEGVYAWAMPSALMIAYTRHGRSMSRQLVGLLSRDTAGKYACIGPMQAIGEVPNSHSHTTTVHQRKLAVLPKGAAARIVLRHLWFELA